ncbi:dynamin family protein, partial [Candidatus Bathyarchaeota archaeon]|nr:dynamin family protein [Candidatus Bathyarchaeota archaeon]
MVTGKVTTSAPSHSATAPALQELHLEQKELFDTIDALHALDIDKIVDLPQVVVVGNQSSGKSSVLSAISRVRFPTGSGICTRFPMELALRTEPQERIAVFIVPEKGKRKELSPRASKDDIPAAIDEAKKELGIDKNTREIYRDILRIEIFAPDVPNLTLVDLPGLYCGESQRQSLRGKDVALDIARQYMSQKRCIILAVISANTDISMDNAINLAKNDKVNPSLSRVLGTITQVDRIDRNRTETQEYLRIASGEDPTLLPRHGWHVLRNLSEEEVRSGLTEDDRDNTESEYFRKSSWKDYPSENKGIPNLCKKLSMLLVKHVSDSLPRVIGDIEEAIAS